MYLAAKKQKNHRSNIVTNSIKTQKSIHLKKKLKNKLAIRYLKKIII